MPRTRVVFYREREGSVPVLEWPDSLPAKIQDKCVVKIERLRELGHELGGPKPICCKTGSVNCGLGGRGFLEE